MRDPALPPGPAFPLALVALVALVALSLSAHAQEAAGKPGTAAAAAAQACERETRQALTSKGTGRVEVTFNYRLPIPFANMLIYRIVRGQEQADMLWLMRLGSEATQLKARESRAMYDAMADAHLGYVLPLRASYAMRMMSDLYPDKNGFELPSNNECTVPFAKGGGE